MGRGDYRIDVVTTADGSLAATPSQEWKRELMTPVLDRVKGPLATRVWRYMRFEHLDTALRKRSLYFPRAELLGDPWEGSFSDAMDFRTQDVFKDWTEEQIAELQSSHVKLRRETMQRLFFASCWHMNPSESELLWGHYAGKYPEAIAVASTLASLCTLRPSLIPVGDIEFIPRVFAGEVTYIDHKTPGSVPPGELSLFYKGRQFSGDNEFRVIVELWNMGWSQHDRPDLPAGINVEFAPAAIVDEIVVKPKTPELKEKVDRLLDEVGYNIPVRLSKLDRAPIW